MSGPVIPVGDSFPHFAAAKLAAGISSLPASFDKGIVLRGIAAIWRHREAPKPQTPPPPKAKIRKGKKKDGNGGNVGPLLAGITQTDWIKV